MIGNYFGEYTYSNNNVLGWNSGSIGVYYLFEGRDVVYVGSGTGNTGIRGRLLSHLNEGNFPQVTGFGYKTTTTVNEALAHEKNEIERLCPKYNKQHNRLSL